jgi:hypothetical protein
MSLTLSPWIQDISVAVAPAHDVGIHVAVAPCSAEVLVATMATSTDAAVQSVWATGGTQVSFNVARRQSANVTNIGSIRPVPVFPTALTVPRCLQILVHGWCPSLPGKSCLLSGLRHIA